MIFNNGSLQIDLNYVDCLAQLLGICIFSIFCVLFLIKSKNKSKSARNYLLGIAAFLGLYALSRIADLTRYMPLETPLPADVIWYMSTITGTIGLTILLFVLELYILEKKTKFIITITESTIFILGILLGGNSTQIGLTLVYVSSFIALIIPIIYIQIGFKTSDKTRKRAIGAGVGFFIHYAGIVCRTRLVQNLAFIFWGDIGTLLVYICYFGFVFIGLTIYYFSVKFEKEGSK